MRRKSNGSHVNENETPLAVGVDVAASRDERPFVGLTGFKKVHAAHRDPEFNDIYPDLSPLKGVSRP